MAAGGLTEVDLTGWYPALAEHGLSYGPVFQGVRQAWTADGGAYADAVLPDGAAGGRARSGCTRRCWTPRCTRWRSLPSRGLGGPRVPFAFEGAGARLGRPDAAGAADPGRLRGAAWSPATARARRWCPVDSLVLRE
ncbi:polyketide synthase dehydratase domain-containing protein [Micromonospora sp. BRA006-A]|nr:polyketide synthase dehydratase domain-containing protein [Micromonospora sp. BRA006-A]